MGYALDYALHPTMATMQIGKELHIEPGDTRSDEGKQKAVSGASEGH